MNKGIYLKTADIYLRFPEIMEEECNDLAEFLEDEHIVYEGATDIVYNLQKENQELKKQLEENQSLKKQLEEADLELQLLDMITDENIKYKNQQKEFIEFLEKMWKETQDIWYIKILQKYKEIIGDKE